MIKIKTDKSAPIGIPAIEQAYIELSKLVDNAGYPYVLDTNSTEICVNGEDVSLVKDVGNILYERTSGRSDCSFGVFNPGFKYSIDDSIKQGHWKVVFRFNGDIVAEIFSMDSGMEDK